LTDVGNAERLVDRHGHDLRYCHPWKAWLTWDGRRWAVDDSAESARRAKEALTTAIIEEAQSPGSDSAELMKHAARSQSAGKVRGALELASSDVRVVVRPGDLDRDAYLFNCANGTLDLRTGALRSHDRLDLITRLAPVGFDPAATAPAWAAALERWLPEPEIRSFVQRLAGYALTGESVEHVVTIAYGSGANGKSVMLRTLLDLLGDYGLAAAPELLVAYRKPGGASPEVAELAGRRLVAALETDEGDPLHESRVKALTGGDRVKGRALYASHIEIDPTWTLVLATNHLPQVNGQGEAIWRRIALVPFTVTIPEAERDPRLVEKLAEERSGILNWALAGCREWQRAGLCPPDAVRAATAAYRNESDPLAEWLADCCTLSVHARAKSCDLWESYGVHCGGKPAISRAAFGRRLAEMGLGEQRTNRGRLRVGIGLVSGGAE
jgi:putative DNA primase/helicase